MCVLVCVRADVCMSRFVHAGWKVAFLKHGLENFGTECLEMLGTNVLRILYGKSEKIPNTSWHHHAIRSALKKRVSKHRTIHDTEVS